MHPFRSWAYLGLLACLLTLMACQPEPTAETESEAPVDLVNPLIDAANSRWFFFSSACRPFGMVNLSPDNLLGGTWGTGYRYEVDTIRGFSHVHAWQLSGISVMPIGRLWQPNEGKDAYASRFSHDTEITEPGYHKVELDRHGITAELTSTTRVGVHRYTFPTDIQPSILFNLGGQLGPSEMIKGQLQYVSPTEIEGQTVNAPTRRRPKDAPVYFVAHFSQPMTRMDGWKDGSYYPTIEFISGQDAGGVIQFDTTDQPILMKVGISYVSKEQARKNLQAEMNHWDFDQVRTDSRTDWNQWLSRMEVTGGSRDQRVRFYTDLWHALQGRRIISDVDGQYADMTGEEPRTGQIPQDEAGKPLFDHYNSDSFWGAQWTLNTLWHLVYPEVSKGFCYSMLQMYQDGGMIPRGPSGGNYTFVMTGASSTPFIISAIQKGLIPAEDHEVFYEALKKNHLPGGIMSKIGYEHDTYIGGGIEAYIEKGYVPYPLAEKSYGFHQDGAGQTLEYAYQDWTLAELAETLGKTEDAEMFRKRAMNYQHLYDDETGWMRPKGWDGNWLTPFDPLEEGDGWVEATAASATWFVPQDPAGLAQLMGGGEAAAEKLRFCLEQARTHGFVDPTRDDRNHYLNYGNQPSMQSAHLFNYFGQPWEAQAWLREVIDSVYSGVDPYSGYSGDEDQGLMGALAVLMKTGLFSMRGGAAQEPIYELTCPIFDEVRIQLNPDFYPGKEVIIQVNHQAPNHPYIQSASWNGTDWNQSWLSHKDLVQGGTLILDLGPEPNKSWGVDQLPPSLSSN
ncbi:MAG: GH92 family glycosyl hydrolase [Bacteroidota bacterium]